MGDLVVAAAEALVPFLAGGATAVATGTAEEAGSDLYRAATSLVGKIRNRLHGAEAPEVEAVLRSALAEGVIAEEELERVTSAARAEQAIHIGKVKGKNVFIGTTKIDKFEA
jgi:hypothetical protein